jgi:hypothetical protein
MVLALEIMGGVIPTPHSCEHTFTVLVHFFKHSAAGHLKLGCLRFASTELSMHVASHRPFITLLSNMNRVQIF